MKARLTKLFTEYKAMYKAGVLGISTSQIHVSLKLFKALRSNESVTASKNGGYLELSCVIDGISYITLI